MESRASTHRSGGGDPAPPGPHVPVPDGLHPRLPIGLAVFDTELRLIGLNAALKRRSGRSGAGGERFAELVAGPWAAWWTGPREDQLRRVLETGAPAVTTEYREDADTGDGHVQVVSSFRLTGVSGDVTGVATAVWDVTEPHAPGARLALLNELSEQIGSELDVTRTAEEVARAAVPRLADLVAVDLLEGVAHGEEPSSGPVRDTAVLRRAAVFSVTENAPEATYRAGERMTFHPSTPYAGCLATGQPLLIPALDRADDWLAQDDPRGVKIVEAGIHSLMTIPLRARDVTLGLAHFYRWQRPEPFDADDLALARDLVARAAVCVDNARRYTREHQATLALQHSLLPHRGRLRDLAVETAHRYLPATGRAGIAGDCYDVIALSGARVGLAVADVAGRGISAVSRAGRLLTAIRTLAGLDLSPEELLTQLDGLVGRAVDPLQGAGDPGEGSGATCLYAIYDPVTGRCRAASAGHPAPAVVLPGRAAVPVDLPVGPPLGVGGVPFEAVEFDLPDDSVIALFTNGLVQDRQAGPDTGLPGLLDALGRADRPLGLLHERAWRAAFQARHPDDDTVLLLARTRAVPAGRVATWDLTADPAVVPRARDLACRQLRTWGLGEVEPLTELFVSELVTNAVRYGRSPIRLRMILQRSLICEVSDASSTSPHLRYADATDEGGRGLFMIAQLADAWGTRYTPTGKTIWTEQAVDLTAVAP